jgi:ABC-type sugar transport system substrate-binding protein
MRIRRAWVVGVVIAGWGAVAASAAFPSTPSLQTALRPYYARPTSIGNFKALKKPPPKGTVVVYLGTQDVSNQIVGNAVQQVAGLARWKYYYALYDPATPATFLQAFNVAIQHHANYVMEAGTPLPAQVVQLATAHHIKIALDAVYPVPTPPGPVIDSGDGYAQDFLMGKLIGEEFIIASHGHGNVVEEAIPLYPILNAFKAGFQNVVKANCPACKIAETDVSLTQFADRQLQSIVVNAVKAHPGYKYLVFDNGPFADGVTKALSAQGISGEQILGEAGDTLGFENIQRGTNLAWTGYSVPFDAYQMMDAAFRNSEGMKVPAADATQPTQVVTRANVAGIIPTLNNALGGWALPANSLQQFERIWHLG